MLEQTDHQWQAVQGRDRSADGEFVYAVRTTGVYCRPSCASRLPKRENVAFFALPAAAEAAGFRACRRCNPRSVQPVNPQAALVESMCDHLRAHADDGEALTLGALSSRFHYSPQHLHELFRSTLGITPRQYVEVIRMEQFRQELRTSKQVTEALYEAGFSSPSRVYEHAASRMGMTPRQYQRLGADISIRWGTAPTPFGTLLIGLTERGACAVGLYDDPQSAENALEAEFPRSTLIADDTAVRELAAQIVDNIQQGAPLPDLSLDVQATAFQWKVWRALQTIPRGETRTYGEVARMIGEPTAARAVAAACASNHAAIVIPCHRVIGSSGDLRGYKWGVERKAKLLEAERA